MKGSKAEQGTVPVRRKGPKREDRETRITAILDTAEELLVKTGYGAVSTRKVAQEAGLTPSLVHYYFKTTDDLLVAVYRRAAQRSHTLQFDASDEGGIAALWDTVSDNKRMALAIEFMALANHRPAIREEIARSMERVRSIQQQVIERELASHPGLDLPFSPLVLTVIAAGLGQALVMEEGVGITLGHAETRAQIHGLIDHLLAPRRDDGTRPPS